MSSWSLPDGWTLEASTERIEVTRGGGPPDWQADVVRQFIPGETRAWLKAPDGTIIALLPKFTLADVEYEIEHHEEMMADGVGK